jgi:hypothetical protein
MDIYSAVNPLVTLAASLPKPQEREDGQGYACLLGGTFKSPLRDSLKVTDTHGNKYFRVPVIGDFFLPPKGMEVFLAMEIDEEGHPIAHSLYHLGEGDSNFSALPIPSDWEGKVLPVGVVAFLVKPPPPVDQPSTSYELEHYYYGPLGGEARFQVLDAAKTLHAPSVASL